MVLVMNEWMRHIPHPTYGNWCGAKKTHEEWNCPPPIDEGDGAGMTHDFALRNAVNGEDRKAADDTLWGSWKAFKPTTMYGICYRTGLLMAFKP